MILKMCLHLVAVFLGNLLRDVWQDLSAIDISWAEILYRKKKFNVLCNRLLQNYADDLYKYNHHQIAQHNMIIVAKQLHIIFLVPENSFFNNLFITDKENIFSWIHQFFRIVHV